MQIRLKKQKNDEKMFNKIISVCYNHIRIKQDQKFSLLIYAESSHLI